MTETCTDPVLRVEGNRLVLVNDSRADLPPRSRSEEDRGYILELKAGANVWADAEAGDFFALDCFWDVSAREDQQIRKADANKGNLWRPIDHVASMSVPAEKANRLRFSFGALRAGQSLRSGLVRLNPNSQRSSIRYRILPIQSEWKPVDGGHSEDGGRLPVPQASGQ